MSSKSIWQHFWARVLNLCGPGRPAHFAAVLRQVTRAEAKDILFDNTSRKKMQDGINKIAGAVSVTLGPRGRNVVLEQDYGVPQVGGEGGGGGGDWAGGGPSKVAGRLLSRGWRICCRMRCQQGPCWGTRRCESWHGHTRYLAH